MTFEAGQIVEVTQANLNGKLKKGDVTSIERVTTSWTDGETTLYILKGARPGYGHKASQIQAKPIFH